MDQERRRRTASPRFGIGEWYGRPFADLTPGERRRLAQIQLEPPEKLPDCPFLSLAGSTVSCWKKGGVCSLRKYDWLPDKEEASPSPTEGALRVTCPSRFEENSEAYRWIGEVVLGSSAAVPIGQINFLERVPLMGTGADDPAPTGEVGRIDNIVVVPNTIPLHWCAVEVQAVYFSGDSMDKDFAAIRSHVGEGLPFPAGKRRPDYRSSGPKRLMPQLQVKVPTLRRWGKKMAVVVDEEFFRAMGKMSTVTDMSNCDVAWFVVRFDSSGKLSRGDVYLTTLEESVQSLVAGRSVSLPEFEERILTKMARGNPGPI